MAEPTVPNIVNPAVTSTAPFKLNTYDDSALSSNSIYTDYADSLGWDGDWQNKFKSQAELNSFKSDAMAQAKADSQGLGWNLGTAGLAVQGAGLGLQLYDYFGDGKAMREKKLASLDENLKEAKYNHAANVAYRNAYGLA